MSNIVKMSTALAAAWAVTGALKDLLDGGIIRIYSGTEPATADAVKGGGTLLREIWLNGDGSTGLTFDVDAANGVLHKPSGATWQSEVSPAASGTASWWRFNANTADDNSAVAGSNYRLQGSCATDVSGSLFMGNLALGTGVQTTLATVQFPIATGA